MDENSPSHCYYSSNIEGTFVTVSPVQILGGREIDASATIWF